MTVVQGCIQGVKKYSERLLKQTHRNNEINSTKTGSLKTKGVKTEN